jgi:hypothetical protein
MLTLALFATLPLGLLSFFSRSRGAHAGIGFLAALAPVLASAVGGIFNRKAGQNQQQQQIDFQRQQAEQEEAQRRAQFEAMQGSPQAAMQRLGFNTRLSRLLGGFGGREQTPGFILNAFDQARMPQEYTPGAEFIAPPKRGGGFFDYAGDILGPGGAASYFDVQRYNQGRQGGAQPPGGPGAPPATPTGGGGSFGQGLANLLPSNIRSQQFNLGPIPAADDFLSQRRTIPGRG